MHEFPYTANSPTGGRLTINDQNDLIELFKSFLDFSGEVFYSFVKQTICPNRLRDSWADSVVHRYFYCQNNNVPPYPGGYDDQPYYWLDVSRLIQGTVDEIKNCTCNIHAKRN